MSLLIGAGEGGGGCRAGWGPWGEAGLGLLPLVSSSPRESLALGARAVWEQGGIFPLQVGWGGDTSLWALQNPARKHLLPISCFS